MNQFPDRGWIYYDPYRIIPVVSNHPLRDYAYLWRYHFYWGA